MQRFEVCKLSKAIENPKELIMNNAKDIVLKEGYSKLNMRTLAKCCGIALGTIYNYYPTKKDLIVEMMEDYWEKYFLRLNVILESEDNFYVKLTNIYEILSKFITMFKQIWLKPDLYHNQEYIEGGLERQNIFIHRLILEIEKILKEEITEKNINLNLCTFEFSKFILMNIISVIQTPNYDYETFEGILRKLLKQEF